MDMKETLAAAIATTAKEAIAAGVAQDGVLPEIMLEVPPEKEFGDFATNFAMKSARALRCNPRALATYIKEHLDCPVVDRIEVAGPGFINFYLKRNWTAQLLASMVERGAQYGRLTREHPEKIQVEFVSANPTGLLHVGHGRGAAVGSALANLLEAAGYDVEREYYINDAGNQMNKLAASVNAHYLTLHGVPTEVPADGYHGADILDTAKRIQKLYGDKYMNMPEAERLAAFRTLAYQEKLAILKEDLEAFNCHFDVWFSELTLHPDKINEAVATLEKTDDIYTQDGAKWLRSSKYGDDKDRVVIRESGEPTYLAADIAYHKNKFERGFDRVINLWGADHHGYIVRLKAALTALGLDADKLEILLLQMVRLLRGGEEVKLSKRTGQTVTMQELIEEVGTDAARYFFCMRSLDSQLDFDMTLATSQSNENPVFYVQYAHARICSILRQMESEHIAVQGRGNYERLQDPAEVDLIKKLGEYEELLAAAAEKRAVQSVATYVYELAGLFHSFYNHCRILGVDAELQQARLALVLVTQHVIRQALGILGVSAPEHM